MQAHMHSVTITHTYICMYVHNSKCTHTHTHTHTHTVHVSFNNPNRKGVARDRAGPSLTSIYFLWNVKDMVCKTTLACPRLSMASGRLNWDSGPFKFGKSLPTMTTAAVTCSWTQLFVEVYTRVTNYHRLIFVDHTWREKCENWSVKNTCHMVCTSWCTWFLFQAYY